MRHNEMETESYRGVRLQRVTVGGGGGRDDDCPLMI